MLQIAQSPVAGQVLFADLSDDDAVEAIGESAVTAAADAAEAGGAAAFVDGDLPHATIIAPTIVVNAAPVRPLLLVIMCQ